MDINILSSSYVIYIYVDVGTTFIKRRPAIVRPPAVSNLNIAATAKYCCILPFSPLCHVDTKPSTPWTSSDQSYIEWTISHLRVSMDRQNMVCLL